MATIKVSERLQIFCKSGNITFTLEGASVPTEDVSAVVELGEKMKALLKAYDKAHHIGYSDDDEL